MKVFTYAILLITAYLVAWTVSYLLVFVPAYGWDLSYYVSYLVLVWTFQAGEIPGVIGTLSICIFIPLAVLVVGLLRRHHRRLHNAA